MRTSSQIFLGVLLALCTSSVVSANPNDSAQPLDPSVFRAVTNMQLDAAFERFVSAADHASIRGLAGPSSMDCESVRMQDGIETCVVTTSGPTHTAPAALAQQ